MLSPTANIKGPYSIEYIVLGVAMIIINSYSYHFQQLLCNDLLLNAMFKVQ